MSMIEITTNDNQIRIHEMARMMLEIHISKTQEMLLATSTLLYNCINVMK